MEHQSFSDEIERLVQPSQEHERLRQNSVQYYLARVADVFDSVDGIGDNAVPPPICVQVEITNRCNTRCAMCFRWTWANQVDREEMSTPEVLRLLDSLAAFGVESIILSGGEPLCHPDFLTLLHHARRRQLQVGVLTNGIAISERVADALIRDARWVRISLDASTNELYSAIRGTRDGLTRIEQALRHLAAAKQRCPESNCAVGIGYTIQALNIDTDVQQMVALAKDLRQRGANIEAVVFKFAHGEGTFLCAEGQLRRFDRTIIGRKRLPSESLTNLRYLRDFMRLYSSISDIASGVPMRTFYSSRSTRCFTPYLFSLVDAFGDVFPCCFLYEDNSQFDGRVGRIRRAYRVGNIKESGFPRLWLSDNYQAIRNTLRRVDVKRIPQCARCTRHFLHNDFLTKLHRIYRCMQNALGKDKASCQFRAIVQAYQHETVWF